MKCDVQFFRIFFRFILLPPFAFLYILLKQANKQKITLLLRNVVVYLCIAYTCSDVHKKEHTLQQANKKNGQQRFIWIFSSTITDKWMASFCMNTIFQKKKEKNKRCFNEEYFTFVLLLIVCSDPLIFLFVYNINRNLFIYCRGFKNLSSKERK